MGLISIWPIVENYYGTGLKDSDKKNDYDPITVANNGGFNYVSISASLTESDVLDEAESDIEENEDNQIRIAIADFLYTLFFIGFYVFFRIQSKRVVNRNFKDNVTAGDYAVEIKGLPKEDIEEEEIFKHFERFGEVVEVYLARRYEGMLGMYKNRAGLSFKEGYYKLKSQLNPKYQANLKTIQDKIQAYDLKILTKKSQAELKNEELVVERAYLIYNDISARKKCLKAYASSSKL